MAKIEEHKTGIIAVILLLILIFGGIAYMRSSASNDTPVVSIEASNKKTYKQTDTISASDFTVYAVHEDGKRSKLRTKEFSVSETVPAKTGTNTLVTVFLNGAESVNCLCEVKNERNEIMSFSCGSPVKEDVRAVLYSNGELCFEGRGNCLLFKDGRYPWRKYEGSKEHPITSVSFDEGVEPVSMDGFFSNMDTLIYVQNIPSSVESMNSTFKGCDNLTFYPDLTGCSALLNMESCFEGCAMLMEGSPLPPALRSARNIFRGCSLLRRTPEMGHCTQLSDLTGAFKGCSELTETGILPPNVIYIDETFSGCINLTDMPEIPDTVESMKSAFMGDIALSYLTVIPEAVVNVDSCFRGCTKIEGLLWVDGEPEQYNGFLSGAAAATTVDLQGNSRMMDILANTNERGNVTVNGERPDPELKYRRQVIIQ